MMQVAPITKSSGGWGRGKVVGYAPLTFLSLDDSEQPSAAAAAARAAVLAAGGGVAAADAAADAAAALAQVAARARDDYDPWESVIVLWDLGDGKTHVPVRVSGCMQFRMLCIASPVQHIHVRLSELLAGTNSL